MSEAGGATRLPTDASGHADVDAVFAAAAAHAGVAVQKLDRRALERALATMPLGAHERERATMAFLGRLRQARGRSVRRNARRVRGLFALVTLLVAAAFYGHRLDRKLRSKLAEVERRGAAFDAARRGVDARAARIETISLLDPSLSTLTDALRREEDALSRARSAYDASAADYVAAVRGFPTTPFARLVGLPRVVPLSSERAARGQTP